MDKDKVANVVIGLTRIASELDRQGQEEFADMIDKVAGDVVDIRTKQNIEPQKPASWMDKAKEKARTVFDAVKKPFQSTWEENEEYDLSEPVDEKLYRMVLQIYDRNKDVISTRSILLKLGFNPSEVQSVMNDLLREIQLAKQKGQMELGEYRGVYNDLLTVQSGVDRYLEQFEVDKTKMFRRYTGVKPMEAEQKNVYFLVRKFFEDVERLKMATMNE